MRVIYLKKMDGKFDMICTSNRGNVLDHIEKYHSTCPNKEYCTVIRAILRPLLLSKDLTLTAPRPFVQETVSFQPRNTIAS